MTDTNSAHDVAQNEDKTLVVSEQKIVEMAKRNVRDKDAKESHGLRFGPVLNNREEDLEASHIVLSPGNRFRDPSRKPVIVTLDDLHGHATPEYPDTRAIALRADREDSDASEWIETAVEEWKEKVLDELQDSVETSEGRFEVRYVTE